MRRCILTITALFAACGLFAQGKASWLLHNRESGEYLCEDAISYSFSPSPSAPGAVWTIEAGEGEAAIIVNSLTGRPLMGKEKGWIYSGFGFDQKESAGWYVLSPEGERDMHLVKTGLSPMPSYNDLAREYAAHWTLVRLESEKVPYIISPDGVKESSFLGERSATALSDTHIVSDWHGPREWKLSKDISSFPRFTARDNKLYPALYNMALEESLLDIRPEDGTFMAGMLWPSTWTRDIVYSIYFAYSWIFPEISRKTLEKQTLKNPSEALQDTGSGGSYPVSTDRVVWAIAAWEYYLSTGDRQWLEEAYEGLSNTANKDLHIAYDPVVGLFKGETCSMDWRTHTYPNWFSNADIGDSYSSGTNALHLFLYTFLSKASSILGKSLGEQEHWRDVAARLKEAYQQFWDEDKGLYSCWLYPGFTSYRASDKVGIMSNGLAALLGAADEAKAASIAENFPLYAYGGAVLYPSKPDGYAYHNKSVWPVWQTPLMYSAKACGNYAVTEHLMSSAVRAGALFLTHKENMTYDTGYDRNTALNSDRQLWSVASYLSIVYRILFGIRMSEAGLSFQPFVPEVLGGEISLEGFRWRMAVINIKVKGNGSHILSLKVNGRAKDPSTYILPPNSRGKYSVEIVLGEAPEKGRANIVPAGPGNCWAPVEPVIRLEGNKIYWTEAPGQSYKLLGPAGKALCPVHSPWDISSLQDGWYSLVAVGESGLCSDLSNPVLKASWSETYEVGIRDDGASHKDFSIVAELPSEGDYVLWFEGSNGHGPHDVYCAVRSLFVDGADAATLLMTAEGDWNLSYSSNRVVLKGLSSGKHTFTIRFNPEARGFDDNMSHNRDNLNDWFAKSMYIAKIK